jgi:FMN phosphatase YigB (HAD superfamily)
MAQGVAVFFDIGDTLASPVVEGGHLTGLDVYPFVPEVLARLRAGRGPHGARVALGLASNTGDETAAALRGVLDAAGLLSLVDDELLLFSSVEGLDKSQPAFFARARDRAALPAARCVYVGESEAERAVAAGTGFAVSPHPLHLLHLVTEQFSVTID